MCIDTMDNVATTTKDITVFKVVRKTKKDDTFCSYYLVDNILTYKLDKEITNTPGIYLFQTLIDVDIFIAQNILYRTTYPFGLYTSKNILENIMVLEGVIPKNTKIRVGLDTKLQISIIVGEKFKPLKAREDKIKYYNNQLNFLKNFVHSIQKEA